MMIEVSGIRVCASTRDEVEALEATGVLVNAELFPCDRGSRKFSVGDRLELFGLQEYPELDGEIVSVTGYRESSGELNGYYIKSESGRVERWLNFVWEKRLRAPESQA
jgi:hypothetical protein